ncbi:MAG: filament integrity protein FraC [Phormidesmis sp.]
MEYEPIFPLKAIIFQALFLMVAVTIEAGILRQRLRLGFQTSVQYTLGINLAAVVVGWITFLIIEPLSPPEIKSQIISYILFDRLLINGWTAEIGASLLVAGLIAFFATFYIKLEGLKLFLRSDDAWVIPKDPEKLSRRQRYAHARQGRTETQAELSNFTDAVILANAASFTVILILLLLRAVAQEWV